MSERYRGHIELIENEEGKPKCVACGMCQRACPSGCISLASKSVEYEAEVKGEMKTKKEKGTHQVRPQLHHLLFVRTVR